MKTYTDTEGNAGVAAQKVTSIPRQTHPVWIYGATGLLAGELTRLLEFHPSLQLAGAVSRRAEKGEAEMPHPHLAIPIESLMTMEDAAQTLGESINRGERPVVFLALPHGQSAITWRTLREFLGASVDQITIVDLSADFRLRDPHLYARTYGGDHPTPAELQSFVYGLPEFHRDQLRGAKRAAAPGCFATAIQLATIPAANAGLLNSTNPWILNGITGSSGSGADPKLGTHHPFRHGNFWAYSLNGHRHEAELEQALSLIGMRAPIHFTPHSAPIARGIYVTASLPLRSSITTQMVRSIYAERFAGEPFIEILEDGVPEIRHVAGSNRASIAVSVRGNVLTVLIAIDNIIKGGSGQALQCLNLMLGFPETWGLPRSGLGVC